MKTKLKTTMMLAAAGLVVGGGCLWVGGDGGADDAAGDEVVVAWVGGEAIDAGDFRRRWEKRSPGSDTAEAREAVLDELVERAAMVQRAKAAGLADDPEVVEAIEGLLIARLKETSLNPAVAAVEVGDDEVAARYEAVRDRDYATPARYDVAVLWLNSRGLEPLEERYRERLEAVAAGVAESGMALADGFGESATGNTEHRASRYAGGKIGWLEEGADYDPWRRQVLEIAEGLVEAGETSDVVVSDAGVFLVRLLGREEAGYRNLGDVREEIRERLRNEKREAVRGAFAEGILAGVEVRREAGALERIGDLKTRGEGIAQN